MHQWKNFILLGQGVFWFNGTLALIPHCRLTDPVTDCLSRTALTLDNHVVFNLHGFFNFSHVFVLQGWTLTFLLYIFFYIFILASRYC